ncbi:MAG: hypothetical protein ACRDYA_00050 [Egibacteraceae bacterium]
MSTAPTTEFTPELAANVYGAVRRISALPDVRAAVEANHDENRWWPTTVADPRMRMAVAGWSTRVSYAMVDTYARVVNHADALGFEKLAGSPDADLARLVRPLGLVTARIGYLRSLSMFLEDLAAEGLDPLGCDADALIGRFASKVAHASYKVAQCAVLYSRGYHCGIIPVDSGMVTKLAPALGIHLPSGSVAHEHMRALLQTCLRDRVSDYRRLVGDHGYAVTVPAAAVPSWWLHLVLIYFKRLYLNRAGPRLCRRRPLCGQIIDCGHGEVSLLAHARG